MKLCTQCGLGHDDSATMCRSCGGTLKSAAELARESAGHLPHTPEEQDEQVKFCPVCGLANRATDFICRDCSASLTGIAPSSENTVLREKMAAQEKRTHRYRHIRIAVLIGCGVAMLALLIWGTVSFGLRIGTGAVSSEALLFAFLMFAAAGIAIAFPELDFKLRTWWLSDNAEPSDLYYTMNYAGAGICILVGLLLVIFGFVG